jgi:hypothetical protein
MTDLPIVDEATVDSIFREIESMNVALDNDPIEFGPKRLNNKVAESRDHLTRCEQLFVRVSHWLQLYKRAHRAAQLDFDLAMQDMLANDPEVRAGRNVKDRDAIATVKMRERREERHALGQFGRRQAAAPVVGQQGGAQQAARRQRARPRRDRHRGWT